MACYTATMDADACPECEALRREMKEIAALVARDRPAGVTIQELIRWSEAKRGEDLYQTRILPALSQLRLRILEHQKLTRHPVLPRPELPPGAFTNPN